MAVEIIDRGWASIRRQLLLINNSYTKVGFPEKGTPQDASKAGSGHPPGVKMSQLIIVAAVNEFGAPNARGGEIPDRPFVRPAFDEHIPEMNARVEKEYIKVVDGRSGVRSALERLGEWHKGKIQRKIVEVKEPPNTKATIDRKGSSNPLIDIGQMRQSVQHVEVLK